jgi:hypothetical protein
MGVPSINILPNKNSDLWSGPLWSEGVRTSAVYRIITVQYGDN